MNCAVVWFIYLWISYTRAGRHSAQTTIGCPRGALVCLARYVIIWLCVAEHMHLYMGHELCCCLVYLSVYFVHARGQALHIDYHR